VLKSILIVTFVYGTIVAQISRRNPHQTNAKPILLESANMLWQVFAMQKMKNRRMGSDDQEVSFTGGDVCTETIDLNSLFAEDIPDSGSFEIQGEIWASTFGKVIQVMPISVLLIDESLKVMAANKACEKISPEYETILGRPFSQIFANLSDVVRSESLTQEVLSTRKISIWEAMLKIDKHTIWGRLTLRTVRIRNQRFLLVIVEDLSLEKKQSLLDRKYREELARCVEERTEELKRLNEKLLGEIAERRHSEEALKESERRFRTIFENIDLGVSLIDSAHNIIMINDALGKAFNRVPSEFIGKKCFREFERREAICPHCPGVKSMASGQPAEVELSIKKDDGDYKDIRIQAFPTFGSDGMVTGFTEIVEDITERKRAEQEKERLRAQLVQSQKMESIGTLAGGIAHDFNNLLTVILGYSELIISEKQEGDRDYEDLTKIIHAARTAGDMVHRILAFSRRTETKRRPIDLNRQVEQLRKMLSRLIPKTIEVEISLDPGVPTVNADPVQIEQVLMNLAVNARDAMPDGGRLLIETRTAFLDEEYCRFHLEASQGRHALLVVRDTGVGIEKDTINRIFEPFFTTKKTGQGTGLGLAVVYGIVKAHGGHVTCESEPGKGTSFSIYLPAHEVDAVAHVTTFEECLSLEEGTILLVDDEEFVRQLGQRVLEKAGYTVITAANGQEAIAVFKEKGKRISLVILDLIMPVMDGNQCLREILRLDPSARVLIASGYSPDVTIRETLERGAIGFVGKPYNVQQLLKTVRDTLKKATGLFT
jgi:PAS domain S-box-containing protein